MKLTAEDDAVGDSERVGLFAVHSDDVLEDVVVGEVDEIVGRMQVELESDVNRADWPTQRSCIENTCGEHP